ncbi:MFS transporter [Pseudarthrobacter phenanthrenivorans]|uniref:Major Facilitator Superfamily transporter n=1 Tax=Pseudarthrobacter phenanthrenivorans (strain DSM 18606 / JCM 16027 / LMG 23796 / Sphe3) TaxID=930171 RepID=F0M837_PSEPM|nr:MFS transporter [Pseudarthrobacter phenanthrenivorans]ADX72633.1 Major Facilitator Superfamily transporter [Pseudarthrobacter phenanthrenivorans Sphe3]TPV51322.1 MFS transporter [Pseudarthrobacter phenanthrenivorans]
MNFALYRELLAVRPIRRLLLVGMVARIPHSAAGVLLTLHIVLTLDQGYAAAGAAAAVMTIGIAVGAPWRGRRVDTVGLRTALIPSVISESVIWSVVPHVSYQWLLPLVFVGGLLTLPIFSVVRQSLGVLADGDQRRTAFALDAITTEIVFMIGPAAGAIVATSGFTVLGLTVVGVSTSLAGLFLMWFNPPTRSAGQAGESSLEERHAAEAAVVAAAPAHLQEPAAELAHAEARGGPGLRGRVAHNFAWFTATVAAVFAVAAGAGMVLSGTDVGIVAALELGGHQREIGIVFVFWCAASVVGGLVYGAMHRPVSPILLLLGMAALTIPMGFAHDTWTLAFVSILPGLLCAPVLSSASEKVADLVAEDRRGEAMGWYGSALTAGVALGAPLAGIFIDGIGPSGGFVSVGVAGVVLCFAGLVLQQRRRRAAV